MRVLSVLLLVIATTLLCAEARSLRNEMEQVNGAYLELLDHVYDQGDNLAASPLTPLDTNLDACHPKSQQIQQCKNQIAQLTANTLTGASSAISVEDALSGVNDWMDSFKKRIGHSQSLWGAAKAAVAPLLTRLRRTQQQAVERLIDSNEAIMQHVQEVATQHIYNLLRASRKRQDSLDASIEKNEQRRQIREELEDKKLDLMAKMPTLTKKDLNNATVSVPGADPKALKAANREEQKLESEVKKALGV